MSIGRSAKRFLRSLTGCTTRRLKRSSGDEARRLARIRAENARDAGQWADAARYYEIYLEGADGDASNRVQFAHALKECGRLGEAETAYREAIALRRDDAETYLHLGHVLKLQGRIDDAKTAYSDALIWHPKFGAARDELVALGGRGRLPHHAYGRDAVTERLASLGKTLEEVRTLSEEWHAAGAFPVQAWDAFRKAYPIPAPPPGLSTPLSISIVIDGHNAHPADVRATLNSLLDQAASDWHAVVLCDEALSQHPVGSFSSRDPRISFARNDPPYDKNRATLLTDAGVVLSPQALGWFAWALDRTGAGAIYADHDAHSHHWRTGEVFFDPALYGAPDRDDLASTSIVPTAVILRAGICFETDKRGSERRRAALLKTMEAGTAAHLPRLLTSRWTDGPATDLPSTPPCLSEPNFTPLPGRILVVIPTRDEGAMLRTCVDSLTRTANRPSDLDYIIVDNRSRLPETRECIEYLANQRRAKLISADEPFNWSRLNNMAVAGRTADLLVFANNDVEALSQGWDDVIRRDLLRPEIGVVGARLLYPDGTVQHAGIALNANAGRPVHEGLHSPPGAPGPLGRWNRKRSVSAVTGAFMAVRREVFEALGGFDESLHVAYNDIDFCFKVRRRGMRILYDPEVVLIHHESKTRGYNEDPERQRWDDEELETLHQRWGSILFSEMARNPQWVSANSRVFDGFRDIGPRTILDWLQRSAKLDPWRIPEEDGLAESRLR